MVDTRLDNSTVDDPIEFDRFHREVLPRRLVAGNGALAADDARKIGPLAIRTPAGAFTYVPTDDTIEIVAGEDAAKTVIALDNESWRGLARDLDTPPGLLYGGRVEIVRGNPLRFVRWEPALRAMYHGRPVYDAERVDLHGLDPTATFTMADVAGAPRRRARLPRHLRVRAGARGLHPRRDRRLPRRRRRAARRGARGRQDVVVGP